VNSHLDPVKGEYKLEENGVVKLVWDNSYSYFSSKSLSYRTWVTPATRNEVEEMMNAEQHEDEEK